MATTSLPSLSQACRRRCLPASSRLSMAELRAPRRRDSAVGARGPEASSNDELNAVAASTAVRAAVRSAAPQARHGNRVARCSGV
jgi:hypothetical protein